MRHKFGVKKQRRVPSLLAASHRRSRVASPLGWTQGEVGEVSHFGQHWLAARVNGTRPLCLE